MGVSLNYGYLPSAVEKEPSIPLIKPGKTDDVDATWLATCIISANYFGSYVHKLYSLDVVIFLIRSIHVFLKIVIEISLFLLHFRGFPFIRSRSRRVHQQIGDDDDCRRNLPHGWNGPWLANRRKHARKKSRQDLQANGFGKMKFEVILQWPAVLDRFQLRFYF